MKTFASNYQSPLGEILLLATDAGLKGVYFAGQRYFPPADSNWLWDDAVFSGARDALDGYFNRSGGTFSLPLDLQGTVFQKRIWQALGEIPSGETRTYADIARRVGAPTAVRAVGTAIGRNPVSIVVPCHRVVGSNGNLTGYAGGLDRKAWLLSHEVVMGFSP